jgi:hypothetical protein
MVGLPCNQETLVLGLLDDWNLELVGLNLRYWYVFNFFFMTALLGWCAVGDTACWDSECAVYP